MNSEVFRVLTEAGWCEKRVIDYKEMEENLIDSGYAIFEGAGMFLSEFGLLKPRFINPRSGKIVEMDIDIKKLATKKTVIDAYGKYLGKKIVPIAEIPRLNMTVCITEDGHFYGGYDESFVKLGDNFEETLFSLIFEKKREKMTEKL